MKHRVGLIFLLAVSILALPACGTGNAIDATSPNSLSGQPDISEMQERESSSDIITSSTASTATETKRTDKTFATIAPPPTYYSSITTSNRTTKTSLHTNSTTKPTDPTKSAEYLEMMYKFDLADLDIAYDAKKVEIESKYRTLKVDCTKERQDIKLEIARLQGELLSKQITYQKNLSELQKKKLEASGINNSYYQTLAKQYQDQINSLNSQFQQTESSYAKKIKNLEQQIQEIPTSEALSEAEKEERAALDAWYQEELKTLNVKYGK